MLSPIRFGGQLSRSMRRKGNSRGEGAIALHNVNEDYLTANKAIALAAIQEQTEAVLKNCVSGLSFPSSIGSALPGKALPPIDVSLLGPNGTIASKAAVPVTVSLPHKRQTQAQLAGSLTVSAVNGIARFTDLRKSTSRGTAIRWL